MSDQDIMPFGKYRGEKMEDIPASYLLWLRESGHKGPVGDYIEENLAALMKECPDYINERVYPFRK